MLSSDLEHRVRRDDCYPFKFTFSLGRTHIPDCEIYGNYLANFGVNFAGTNELHGVTLMGPKESLPASPKPTAYYFGDITLDPARRTVRRGNADILLGKLTYELLLMLIEAAPGVVTQKEVAERLWNDRHVTNDTVRQRVKLLRKALDDDAENPHYLSVVRGQGYRIIPDVETILPNLPSSAVSGRRSLVAGLAVVIALAIVYWVAPGPQSTSDVRESLARSIPNEKSIAVLPFESLVPDSDNTYFVDGIHNDLLTQLSKVSSLKIISRTSVLEYQDTRKNLRQIGDELNVATILEGSVQRSGDTVRINVQLIDVESDEHLWAESYDRELAAQNLFAIQSDIATSIARALQAIISPEELARLSEVPTVNTLAYNHYLIGNKYLRGVNNRNVFSNAAQSFQRAVDEDPEFALAWALLSRAHSAVYFFVDHSESRRELARQAIDRAIELDPNLPEAHYAMGYYQYHCLDDTDAALREWDIAEQDMSGDSRLYLARSYVYRRIGEFERAVNSQNQAIELDPRNIEQLFIQWHTYSHLRDYAHAALFAGRIIEIAPDRPIGYNLRSYLPVWRDGDFSAGRTILESMPIEFSSHWFNWAAAFYERDYDAALDVLDGWKVEVDDRQTSFTPLSTYYGSTYQLAGMPDLAEKQFRAAHDLIQSKLKQKGQDPRLLIALGEVLAAQGQAGTAIMSARRAMEILPTSEDAIAGTALQMSAILIYVVAGDYDAAIWELDAYLAAPAIW